MNSSSLTYGSSSAKIEVTIDPPTKVRWHGKVATGLVGLLGMSMYISQNQDRISDFGKAAIVSALSGGSGHGNSNSHRTSRSASFGGEDGRRTLQPYFSMTDGADASMPVNVASRSPHLHATATASMWKLAKEGFFNYRSHDIFIARYDFSASEAPSAEATSGAVPSEGRPVRLLGGDSLLGPIPRGGAYIFTTAPCVAAREVYSQFSTGYFAAYDHTASAELPKGGEGAYLSEGACVSLTVDPLRCTGSRNSAEDAGTTGLAQSAVSLLVLGIGSWENFEMEGIVDTADCRMSTVLTVGPLGDLKRQALDQ
jgi:hypothetical protein